MKAPIALLLLTAACLSAPARASAHVSRCANAEGASTYTDGSCLAIGAKPVPMSANLMRSLAREGALGGDEAFRPTGLPPRPEGGPQSNEAHQLGGMSCPRTPSELATALRDSIGDGRVNRLASLYDWTGKSNREAKAILQKLERMSERPLIDGHYFNAAMSPDSGGTVQLVQGAHNAPTVTEVAVNRRAGCLFLNL